MKARCVIALLLLAVWFLAGCASAPPKHTPSALNGGIGGGNITAASGQANPLRVSLGTKAAKHRTIFGAGTGTGKRSPLFWLYTGLGIVFLTWLVLAVWRKMRRRHAPARKTVRRQRVQRHRPSRRGRSAARARFTWSSARPSRT